jgi:hypothetical protein
MMDSKSPQKQEQPEKTTWSKPRIEKFEMIKTLFQVGTSGGDGGNETSMF